MRTLLALQLALMTLGALLASWLGPFANADEPAALVTGMSLVAAMAIQNSAHRVHLASAPPSTIMTGTTTQIMLDLADVMHGLAPEVAKATPERLQHMTFGVLAFAAGCAMGALLYAWISVWCFWVPPVLALATLSMQAALHAADTPR